MVKNFIIKIITSLVKVQMLQQGVNTPLEEEVVEMNYSILGFHSEIMQLSVNLIK